MKKTIEMGTDLLKILPGPEILNNVILNGLTTLLKIGPEELKDLEQRTPTPTELLTRFGEIATALKVKYVYILVDHVDEVFDQNQAWSQTAELVRSLVSANPLLELKPYAFKFFLPFEIRDHLKENIRHDRFDIYSYSASELWVNKSLQDLFEQRLSTYCDHGKVPNEEERKNFLRLFDNDFRLQKPNLLDEMIDLAEASPRNLLRLARIILDEHTRLPPISSYITAETYDRVVRKFEGVKV